MDFGVILLEVQSENFQEPQILIWRRGRDSNARESGDNTSQNVSPQLLSLSIWNRIIPSKAVKLMLFWVLMLTYISFQRSLNWRWLMVEVKGRKFTVILRGAWRWILCAVRRASWRHQSRRDSWANSFKHKGSHWGIFGSFPWRIRPA